jgi:dTDP-glucose 4,6-dehydratase
MLQNRRLFLTGGTGFFGKWLLSALMWLVDHQALDLEVVVLSRSPQRLWQAYPSFGRRRGLIWWIGDLYDCEFPPGTFDYVIHAGTPASLALLQDRPMQMWDTIVTGTRRTLDFAVQCHARRFLMVSSGAVYGKQPHDVDKVTEEYRGAPDCVDPRSCYGEGKRAAEQLCSVYGYEHGLSWSSARCFAFVGPHLPLDTHFAIGNFLYNALRGEPIEVRGDGTPLRSYMYMSDLVHWLLRVLLSGEPGRAYNVGSDHAVSLLDAAAQVKEAARSCQPIIVRQQAEPGCSPDRYVPSVHRARNELGLSIEVGLQEAIKKTIEWYRVHGSAYYQGTFNA